MYPRAWILALLGVVIAGGSTPAGAIVLLPRPSRPPAPVGWTYEWVPPVFQQVTERAWTPGASVWVRTWIEIAPGCPEEVWRTVETPGHWSWTTRQVITSPGYWRLVKLLPPPTVSPPMLPPGPPVLLPRPEGVGPPSTGVEGYSSTGGEDLGKFSGLSEWPK
jgi:hypothetical protein